MTAITAGQGMTRQAADARYTQVGALIASLHGISARGRATWLILSQPGSHSRLPGRLLSGPAGHRDEGRQFRASVGPDE
jgi:hypothetical protein